MFKKQSEPVAPEYDLMSAASQDVNAVQVRNVPLPTRPWIQGELVAIDKDDNKTNTVIMKIAVNMSVTDKKKHCIKTQYDRFTLGNVVVIQ